MVTFRFVIFTGGTGSVVSFTPFFDLGLGLLCQFFNLLPELPQFCFFTIEYWHKLLNTRRRFDEAFNLMDASTEMDTPSYADVELIYLLECIFFELVFQSLKALILLCEDFVFSRHPIKISTFPQIALL